MATTPQDAALAVVQAYCGWHVSPELDQDLVLDGSGTGVLVLPSLHVTAVESITEAGTLLVDGTDYEWSATGVVRRSSGASYWRADCQPRWSYGLRSIQAVFKSGYTTMPPALQVVVDQLVDRSQAGVPVGLASRTVGPFTESYTSGSDLSALTAADKAILDRYRLPWRA